MDALRDGGAVILDEADGTATHICCRPGTTVAEAQQQLQLRLPAAAQQLSAGAGVPGVELVMPSFFGSCLSAGRKLEATAFRVQLEDGGGGGLPVQREVGEQEAEERVAAVTEAGGKDNPRQCPGEGTGEAGIPECGWVEDYNVRAARATVEALFRHWHRIEADSGSQTDAAGRRAGVGEPEGPAAEEPDGAENGESGSEGRGVAGAKRGREESGEQGGSCKHMCCSRSQVCFIAELKKVRALYSPRDTGQFKAKALDRGVRELASLTVPLQTPQQLEGLRLGGKTAQKVREIMATGRVRRTAEAVHDTRRSSVLQLMRVWGCGEKTAGRWYELGCRTVEDVAAKVPAESLTMQQAIGLKHFEDLQRRIPRREAAAIASVVTQQALAVVADGMGCEVDDIRGEVFAEAMGSFRRGAPTCGDVDCLIVLPPPASGQQPLVPAQVLAALLLRLQSPPQQLLQGRDGVRPPAERGWEHAASWMGVCRPGWGAHSRRLDVKVYPHGQRACAVNYFTGSGPFNRALRFWCNSPPASVTRLAAAAAPGADSFRLSDTALQPVRRRPRRFPNDPGWQAAVGEAVPVATETDIFQAVGLAYVPPHMRWFQDYQ